MEQLACKYPTKQPVNKKIHVGVVGSGDSGILIFPTEKIESTVKICIGSDGFGEVWNNVLTRSFDCYPISAGIATNDFGAIPGVAYLRLTQVMEELPDEK